MSASRPHEQGLALMVLLWVLACAALLVGTSGGGQSWQGWLLKHQQQEATQQTLQHIREDLLAHATMKGYNSLTHIGNLPCPSAKPNDVPPAACSQARQGWLPVFARSAQSHLRLTAGHAALPRPAQKGWAYAVSQQVVQPNELGWSQWVDWGKTSLTVTHLGTTHTGVAAVVAEQLTPIEPNHVEAHGATLLIDSQLLQQYAQAMAQQLVNQQWNRWLRTVGAPFGHEAVVGQGSTFTARWPACACECTRNRCQCGCEQPSWWTSNSPCTTPSDACKPLVDWMDEDTQHPAGWSLAKPWVCKAGAGDQCRFNGSAQPLSAWPITANQPNATPGKACERLTAGPTCALSTSGSTPCRCQYNWPDPSKPYLNETRLPHAQTP